jgi:SAM-dependent methyltransferase
MTERKAFYASHSLAVETYDARTPAPDRPPIAGDVEFYSSLAQRTNGPVLELGAGTGRVVWALAEAGFEVVGLDISGPMLERAEAKRASVPVDARERATFVQGDMTGFTLDRSFGLAVAAFRAFQSLLTPESQRRSLECVYRHLRPGGLIALDLFDPRLEFLLPGSDAPRMRGELRQSQTSAPIRFEIIERRTDPLTQTMEEIWRFEELDDGGKVLRHEETTLALRWTYRWEMRYLLELCGFEIEAEYSDFRQSPPAYGLEQVWVAGRP